MVTIKQRLAIGFTVLIALTVGLTCYSIIKMGQLQDRVNAIVTVSAKRVALAEQVKENVLQLSLYEKNVILATERDSIEQQISLTERYSEVVDKNLAALQLVVSTGQGKYLEDFFGAWSAYLLITREVHDLVREETWAKARKLSKTQSQKTFDESMRLISLMKDKINGKTADRSIEANAPNRFIIINLLETIEAHLYTLRNTEEEIVINNGGRISDSNITDMDGSVSYIGSFLERGLNIEENNAIEDWRWLNESITRYLKNNREVIALILRDSLSKAQSLSTNEGDEKLLQSLNLLDKVIDVSKSQMQLDRQESNNAYVSSRNFLIVALVLVALSAALGGIFLARSIVSPLYSLIDTTKRLADGDIQVRSNVAGDNEVGILSDSFNAMAATIEERVLVQTGLNKIANAMRGSQNVTGLAENVIHTLANVLDIPIGAIYMAEKEQLRLAGNFACHTQNGNMDSYRFGEGIVGQAASTKETILLSIDAKVEPGLQIHTGVSVVHAKHVLAQPLIFNDTVIGVIVIGDTKPLSDVSTHLVKQVSENIAIAIDAADLHLQQRDLLLATQKQAAELNEQQFQLGEANKELESKTNILEESQLELRQRGQELENINKALELQTEQLEKQKKEIEEASEYKSEFLANMSHELRTPLNSLLLLSKTLSKNQSGNLSEQQVESLNIIHTGGQDLLCLINDILDLSKVEAGKLDVYFEPLNIQELCDDIHNLFKLLMQDKGIEFEILIDPDVPTTLLSDRKRMTQIIRNFLSNAFKFTHQGKIEVRFSLTQVGQDFNNKRLSEKDVIAIAVKDSGIGISEENQRSIFEAFQQADGSTNRKYGGTGLGLAISKKLAELLNGEIHLHSKAKEGSTFTLYLPLASRNTNKYSENGFMALVDDYPAPADVPREIGKAVIEDDRNNLQDEDRILLIIEDDFRFSHIMMTMAHARGYKCIRADDGGSGLELAQSHQPNAITLDMGLPDMGGEHVFKHLQANPKTAHIPVHIITAEDRSSANDSITNGATSYLSKPITPEDLDVILNCAQDKRELKEVSSNANVSNTDVSDAKIPNAKVWNDSRNTPSSHNDKQITQTRLWNNNVSGGTQASDSTRDMDGKIVLIVDDDIRNMFALSEIMQDQGMRVVKADNGELAVQKLVDEEDVDIVLMDIMMPVMDGYEATREIRKKDRFEALPIIALTANAMPQDRELCLSAGATEYLSKPIDEKKLLDMMGRLLS